MINAPLITTGRFGLANTLGCFQSCMPTERERGERGEGERGEVARGRGGQGEKGRRERWGEGEKGKYRIAEMCPMKQSGILLEYYASSY